MIKLAIARRQLGTALALFLDDKDPVSVHCLACGGGELAYRLAQSVGKESWFDTTLAANPTIRWKELFGHRNRFWNAMKHATDREGLLRTDDDLLSQFNDAQNDELLFISIYDFGSASEGYAPLEMFLFMYWFNARYPDLLGPCELQSQSEALFPEIVNASRREAKSRLRRVIDRYRKNPSLWLHRRHDQRQLILNQQAHPLPEEPHLARPDRTNDTVH
ncbi:hypothetical protein [Sphingomonas sp. SUN039]|uniref:hypothetical protein n=1 Tax=Sphingomonas sp. SUN039 TaxID=2937787 RepID=UPI0021643DD7|nr:hypothetical protein [Sphingomonas sp. SUN039]UVO52910.1 hypothetical protein M0209_01765 [Sphingomonas sp. SUN039]